MKVKLICWLTCFPLQIMLFILFWKLKSLKHYILRAFSVQCRTCAYSSLWVWNYKCFECCKKSSYWWFVVGFGVMQYPLCFSKWWEKVLSRVFLWKRSILQRKHFWKIQMICIVNENKLWISLSIKWLMSAYGNFFKVFGSDRLKNVSQLQEYIFTCWTLHICFALHWWYLLVNVDLPFWGEEFLGSWRRRKEGKSLFSNVLEILWNCLME